MTDRESLPTPPTSPTRAGGAAVLLDGAGRVAGWSAAAAAWTGVAEKDALGRPAAEAGLPDPAAWAPLVEAARADGRPRRGGPLPLSRAGAPAWVEVAVVPVPTGGGGTLLLLEDAGERARETETLREIAIATASTLEPDEIFSAVCSRARALFGADLAAVFLPLLDGHRHWCGDLDAHGGAMDALPDLLQAVRERGVTVVTGEDAGGMEGLPVERPLPPEPGRGTGLLLPLRAGEQVTGGLLLGWRRGVAVSAERLRLAEALAAHAGAAFRNAALHEQVRRSAVQRDRFFSAMSHDLRTPITAIVGYSELLQDGIVGDLQERQQEMVERISQVAGHLSDLVNHILDLAKLDAGRMEFHPVEVPIGQVVDEAAVAVRPQAQAKGLELRLEYGCDPRSSLRADAVRVRQILVNLLSNAVKFTESGEVTVASGLDGDRAWVEVRDTGPGIPSGSEEAVFEEFLQLASGNKAKREPGSGLGLAISRRLARAMGGELTARSEPGPGASFTLSLPRGGED